MNVITQVGFGHGPFKIVGGRGMTKKFIIPPLGGTTKVHIMTGPMMKTDLNFSFFLIHVICPEKPFLCPGVDNIAGSSKETRVISKFEDININKND